MSLIQCVPDGALDIVGDIHGEYQPLIDLLEHLGYSESGNHPEGRLIVFVGDFCDRGPDSPAVLEKIESLVASKNAIAILGNHEINLLRGNQKDGSGWFFDAQYDKDRIKYGDFVRASKNQKKQIEFFLKTLPIGLERKDIRIIHAAWIGTEISKIRNVQNRNMLEKYEEWDSTYYAPDLLSSVQQEKANWGSQLQNQDIVPPFLSGHGRYAEILQMSNPIRVLTGGVERCGTKPYYLSGKWRFVDRIKWWDDYMDDIPVVIGHYWRKIASESNEISKSNSELFFGYKPNSWHGKKGNVFCVDYSVGGKAEARRTAFGSEQNFKLAALRWPEKIIQFNDGEVIPTENFLQRPEAIIPLK